jgi:hypothetical protein
MNFPRAQVFFLLSDDELEALVKKANDKPYNAYQGRLNENGTQYYEVEGGELTPTELQNWGKRRNTHVSDSYRVQPSVWSVLDDMVHRQIIPPGLYLVGAVPDPT